MSASHWGVFFTFVTLLGAVFATSTTGDVMVPAIITVLAFQTAAIICFLAGSRKTMR